MSFGIVPNTGYTAIQQDGVDAILFNSNGIYSGVAGAALKLGTAVATTSGTSIDFTGIPSWVKRITVMLSGVSTNGTSIPILQLGDSGGIETSGYSGLTDVTAHSGYAGFVLSDSFAASSLFHGQVILTSLSSTTWVTSILIGKDSGNITTCLGAGTKTLSGTLDRIRLTTVNGTDTFDAGSVNIMYE